jgi:hypothetical protein
MKKEGIQQDPHEGPKAGDQETSSRDFQPVTDNQGVVNVEGSNPSKTEKEREAGNVEAQASTARVRVRERERNRKREKNERKHVLTVSLPRRRSGRTLIRRERW